MDLQNKYMIRGNSIHLQSLIHRVFGMTTYSYSCGGVVVVLLSWLELSSQRWTWDGEATGSSGIAHWLTVSCSSELGGVSSISISSRLTSNSNNSSVDSTWNAVLHLDVKLWHNCSVVLVISGCSHDVLLGWLIDQLFHHKSLNGFILSDTSSAVDAVDLEVEALIFLSPSVVSSLWWHFYINENIFRYNNKTSNLLSVFTYREY